MNYKSLTKKQKEEFRKICDEKYGATFVKNQSGEPLYFDEDAKMINTKPILEMFSSSKLN